jgi:hypothetical protein
MVPPEVRELIRIMSRENPIWGAPRIHGELLKLGIDIGETSVSKYMMRRRRPPSQTWKTFLANHVKSMVSVDFLTVPTIRFQILYVFLVLARANAHRPTPECVATALAMWRARYFLAPRTLGLANAPALRRARQSVPVSGLLPLSYSAIDGDSRSDRLLLIASGSHSGHCNAHRALPRLGIVPNHATSSILVTPRQRLPPSQLIENIAALTANTPTAFVCRDIPDED